MPLVTLTDVTKYYGAELVLDSVSLRLERGEHAALVGRNGTGKSTILRIMAGLEEPDAGSVSIARGVHVAYLEQEPEFDPNETLYEVMLDAFAEALQAQERLRALEERMTAEGDHDDLIEEYGHLQSLVEHAGYDYRERIERVLTGLGLEETHWYTSMGQLSGGQRTRANLARTLLEDADVLLLDEPTNHLDIPAVEWLEGYLRDLKRTFLIVAHDRYLLDRVTRRTFELSLHHITEYDAPYSKYLDLRAERMERQRLEYEAQQEFIAKTEDFIRRYGAGQRSKEARGRQKRLARMERIARPEEEGTAALNLKGPKRTGDLVLEARHLLAGYPDKPLVRLPDEVVVRRGDTVAIIGPNGAGKTTLLRTLINSLPPLEGSVRWGSNTEIGYYSQTLGQLDENRTVLEEIQRTKPLGEEEARNYLGQFLFSGDDVFKRIGVLSGGEKSRVALAKLILEAPNVLVLDEPTNHLDIASRDVLQDVLDDFSGTLLFVSHDRYLIDNLTRELWVVSEGRLRRFEGTYSEYASGKAQPLDRDAPAPRKRERQEAPDARVTRLEGEAEALAGRLAEAGRTTPLQSLTELIDRYGELLEELREADRQWTRSIREDLRASSGSPARSGAAKRQ